MELTLYDEAKLREVCPLKWHSNIPKGGSALGIADIDFAGPRGIAEYLKARLNDDMGFYQQKEGTPRVLERASDYLRALGSKFAQPNKLQITPGTMMGIYSVMHWIRRTPGHIVMTNPIYPPIHFHASYEGNRIEWLNIKTGFDHEVVKEKVSKDTKLFAINNPNNPTGYLYSKEDLALIGDLATDYDFICFSDELYEPLSFSEFHPASSVPALEGRTISLYGVSKAYGLAGFRAGLLLIDLPELSQIKEVVEHLMVSPSPITSHVLEFALSHENSITWKKSFQKRMHQTTDHAYNFLQEAGYSTYQPEGCFFVFPDLQIPNSEDFSQALLKDKGVEVVAGSKFGPAGEGHVRINCSTSIERLDQGLEKIVQYLNNYSRSDSS